MDVQALHAFEDNYIWLLREGRQACVVDPGDAAPVLHALDTEDLQLVAILVTHHHGDHTGGIAALLERFAVPVYGPAGENIPTVSHPVREGDAIELPGGLPRLSVLEIPGHTRGHVAYCAPGLLFSGDTLFGAGCGRLFEGTAEMMAASLHKLTALPATTRVYCAHEYTQSNLRFALAVEPGNTTLQRRAQAVERQRAQGQATVPLDLAEELATNPFLRCAEPEVIAAATEHDGAPLADATAVFAALRRWKDQFR